MSGRSKLASLTPKLEMVYRQILLKTRDET